MFSELLLENSSLDMQVPGMNFILFGPWYTSHALMP